MRDAEVIAVCVGTLIAAFACAGLYWWALFIGIFGIVLGGLELYLWQTRKETLSSQFWKFREAHREVADFLLLTLTFFFALLLLHLRGCL